MDGSPAEIEFRPVYATDFNTIKELCTEWFPIRYDDSWYQDVAYRNDIYISFIARCKENDENSIDGLLVAEVKSLNSCQNEDSQIIKNYYKRLQCKYPETVCYILILGVRKEMRRRNIAGSLIEHLLNVIPPSCFLLYLHVLDSNQPAISFYEKQGFSKIAEISDYYRIDNQPRTGLCYTRILDHDNKLDESLDYLNSNNNSSQWFRKIFDWMFCLLN